MGKRSPLGMNQTPLYGQPDDVKYSDLRRGVVLNEWPLISVDLPADRENAQGNYNSVNELKNTLLGNSVGGIAEDAAATGINAIRNAARAKGRAAAIPKIARDMADNIVVDAKADYLAPRVAARGIRMDQSQAMRDGITDTMPAEATAVLPDRPAISGKAPPTGVEEELRARALEAKSASMEKRFHEILGTGGDELLGRRRLADQIAAGGKDIHHELLGKGTGVNMESELAKEGLGTSPVQAPGYAGPAIAIARAALRSRRKPGTQ